MYVPRTFKILTKNFPQQILEYLRLCLWFSAGAKTAPGDPKSVEKVNEYIRNALNNSTEIKDYLALAKRILYAKRGQVELQCLYDLLNATPSTLVNDCFDLKDSFMLGLKDVSDLTRILVAQLQGILMAYGNNESEFNAEVCHEFSIHLISVPTFPPLF